MSLSVCTDANNVSVGKNLTLPPIDVTKSVNIVDAGTLIPPAFTAFALTSGLSGSVEGALTFSAGASGAPLDTGSIQLFSVGIPGFDIPE
jgi:hypothetical protein